MEKTVDKNSEALAALSNEFNDLVTFTEPTRLHGVAWDMFQAYLLCNAGDVIPENIYTYTLIYEFFRDACKHLESISHVPGKRFKIVYEP